MSANRLSLHHLCALDVPPEALVRIAGTLGCGHVTLFTHVPEAAAGFYPSVTRENVEAVAQACAAAKVAVANLEVFPLDADGDLSRFDEGLQIGATLGATRATAHIHEVDDEAQAVRRFAAFCEHAARFGIVAGLEFNAFSAVRDVEAAARIVRAVGQGMLVIDTLHFARGGGDPAMLDSCAGLVDYVQLSDGPPTVAPEAAFREAVRDRMLPGRGSFALSDILSRLGSARIIEAEVPQSVRMKAGDSAEARCADVIAATRELLSS